MRLCFPFFVDDIHWNSTGILLLGMNGIALPCPELSHKYPSIYPGGRAKNTLAKKNFFRKDCEDVVNVQLRTESLHQK